MPRSVLTLFALAALALVAPATASARTIDFSGTAKVRAIEGSTLAGFTTSPQLGRGAAVYVTSPGPSGQIISRFTIFTARGTVRGVATVTQTPGAEGEPTALSGTARIRGGSGRYRGARGRFTVGGQIAPDGLVTIEASEGRITF